MIDKGREILVDTSAKTANPGQPAFVAKPDGAPVYYGFPVVEESYTDGWMIGAITEYIGEAEGDAFVVAPDGSRAGLVWEVGEGIFSEICEPDDKRWGVYAVWFSKPIQSTEDYVANFRGVLPLLQERFKKIRSK